MRVLPSTAGSTILVVTEEGGCRPPSLTCGEERGGLFNIIDSKSRKKLGNYTLELEENLGRHESGTFGLDTVALGLINATAGPSLDSQLVVGIDTNVYYNGIFGLSDQPFNVTNFTDTYPSFLTTLKEQRLIPSLSWAYTAGAPYRKCITQYPQPSETISPDSMSSLISSHCYNQVVRIYCFGRFSTIGVIKPIWFHI